MQLCIHNVYIKSRAGHQRGSKKKEISIRVNFKCYEVKKQHFIELYNFLITSNSYQLILIGCRGDRKNIMDSVMSAHISFSHTPQLPFFSLQDSGQEGLLSLPALVLCPSHSVCHLARRWHSHLIGCPSTMVQIADVLLSQSWPVRPNVFGR